MDLVVHSAGFLRYVGTYHTTELRSLAMMRDRLNACASLMSSLLVAAVVVTGLATLSAENLSGSLGSRQLTQDHSGAIQKILFRS